MRNQRPPLAHSTAAMVIGDEEEASGVALVPRRCPVNRPFWEQVTGPGRDNDEGGLGRIPQDPIGEADAVVGAGVLDGGGSIRGA